jgi:hypothetical protein
MGTMHGGVSGEHGRTAARSHSRAPQPGYHTCGAVATPLVSGVWCLVSVSGIEVASRHEAEGVCGVGVGVGVCVGR